MQNIGVSVCSVPSFLLEDQLRTCMSSIVVGVDEVGYGAIAGPVVAAAVYLYDRELDCIREIRDSKMLSSSKRQLLFKEISQHTKYGIGFASVAEIEEHNILVASHIAMKRALIDLSNTTTTEIGLVLIDGNRIPKNLPWITKAVVKGDRISVSIAAASIVAKVTRDSFMRELHKQHPEYLWNQNCGYGTKTHLLSIHANGITIHHRRTFAPVCQYATTLNPQ